MTQYLQGVLNFSKEYQGQFNRTQLFCKKLQDMNLLEPMKAQITLKDGAQLNLGGFQVVSRTRLKELTDEQLLELAKTDELELIHLHLHSMKNFSSMVERMSGDSRDEDKTSSAVDEVSETPEKTEMH